MTNGGLNRHEMKSFFEPAINDLLAKVTEQKDELATKGAKIDVSDFRFPLHLLSEEAPQLVVGMNAVNQLPLTGDHPPLFKMIKISEAHFGRTVMY